MRDAAFRFHYRRLIVGTREEPIPNYAKQLKANNYSHTFRKELSIWRDWQEDTPKILQQCRDHDFKYWKLKRFCGTYELGASITELIKNNYVQLKDIFTSCVIESGKPPDF